METLTEKDTFIDSYQEWCIGLLKNDVNEDGTVRDSGLKPLPYCLDGIIEETEEIVEPNNTGNPYDRLDIVMGVIQTTDAAEQIEIERHKKEFGDTSWYSAAALSLLGIRLSEAYKMAQFEDSRFSSSLPSLASNHPSYYGLLLVSTLDRLRSAALNMYMTRPMTLIHTDGSTEIITDPEKVLDLKRIFPHDERISKVKELAYATGNYLLTASRVLPVYFGEETTLEGILDQNRAKIEKRIEDNTVYKIDGVGGDDR